MSSANKLLNFVDTKVDKTKLFLSSLLANIIIKIYLIIVIIINIITWLAASYIFSEIEKEFIPLHYNVDFGINYIAKAQNIYIVPTFGLIIIFVNLFIIGILNKHKNKIFITHLLFLASIMSNIFLLLSIISIYLINFI